MLVEKAEEVRAALAGIDGVADVRGRAPAGRADLEVEVDLAAAERYGLKPGDVRRAAATLVPASRSAACSRSRRSSRSSSSGTRDTRAACRASRTC